MDKIERYIGEAITKEKINIKQWAIINPVEADKLRDHYNRAYDHLEEATKYINILNGDTGMFGKDLKLAVQARDAFRKISLGKYL